MTLDGSTRRKTSGQRHLAWIIFWSAAAHSVLIGSLTNANNNYRNGKVVSPSYYEVIFFIFKGNYRISMCKMRAWWCNNSVFFPLLLEILGGIIELCSCDMDPTRGRPRSTIPSRLLAAGAGGLITGSAASGSSRASDGLARTLAHPTQLIDVKRTRRTEKIRNLSAVMWCGTSRRSGKSCTTENFVIQGVEASLLIVAWGGGEGGNVQSHCGAGNAHGKLWCVSGTEQIEPNRE